jgi:hypothetical protein
MDTARQRRRSMGRRPPRNAARRGSWALSLALAASFPALSGCYGALAGAVLGILSLAGGDEAPSPVPVLIVGEAKAAGPVLELGVACGGRPSREVVALSIEMANADGLAAQVEFLRLERRDGGFEPAAPAVRATPAAGSPAMQSLPRGKAITFLWDAALDLEGASSWAMLVVTALQGTTPVETLRATTEPFLAGNTPPRLGDVGLAFSRDSVTVSFTLFDQEGDTVCLSSLELAAAEGFDAEAGPALEALRFEAVPAAFFATIRKDYLSAAAGQGGAAGSFVFDVRALREQGSPLFDALSRRGFVGFLAVRLEFMDFVGAVAARGEAVAAFANNTPPSLAVEPILPEHLKSGVVPIRYTVFDPDGNPVEVDISVTIEDRFGNRRVEAAREFPSRAARGGGACAENRGDDGLAQEPGDSTPGRRTATFLWDALSQVEGDEQVTVTVSARDLQPGSTSEQVVRLAFPFLDRAATLPAGTTPQAMAAGDFDEDGFLDLAVANSASHDLSIFRGGPDGLSPAGLVSLASEDSPRPVPVALATGFFGGSESGLEVMVANRDARTLARLRSVGGQLVRVEEVPLDFRPADLASADFDGDGFDDLVIADETSARVHYFGGSRGGLVFRGELSPARTSRGFAIGFFGGEPAAPGPSLAVAHARGISFFQNVPGGFLAAREIAVSAALCAPNRRPPLTLLVHDFDGDGHKDLVFNPGVELLWSRGGPSGLGEPASLYRGCPEAAAAGDFDGDDWLDLLVVDRDAESLTIVSGGAGGLSGGRSSRLLLDRAPVAVAAGDFNADGYADAAVATDVDSVLLLRGGPAGLSLAAERPAGRKPAALLVGDFDGDGVDDIGARNQERGTITLLRGASSALVSAAELEGESNPVAAASEDFDADGFCDALVLNEGTGQLTWFQGGPGGLRLVRAQATVSGGPRAMTTGDFNDDGYPDALVVGSQNQAALHLGSSAGPKKAVPLTIGTSGPGFLSAPLAVSAFFNDDPFADAVVTSVADGRVVYLEGGGDGLVVRGMTAVLPAATGFDNVMTVLAVADFDLDGWPDLAAAKRASTSLLYLSGSASGLDFLGRSVGNVTKPERFATGDFDADGFPDLVLALGLDPPPPGLVLLRGGPGGLEQAEGLSPLREVPVSMVAADLDGDGGDDLALLLSSGELVWLRSGPWASRRLESVALRGLPGAMARIAVSDFTADGISDLLSSVTWP